MYKRQAEIFSAVSFGTGGFRRSFVIKRLRPEMASNPVAVSQFIDEANLASTLVHPNIVPVFDFGQIGGEYFLAQEYIVGRDLARLTRRMLNRAEPALPVSAILFIAHEILNGLEYAYGKRDDDGSPLGIVHRDVTPDNIMISERGEVKLLDFGIMTSTQGQNPQTDVNVVKGSVDFMSPEQSRGRPVDQRADLFSLGLVIYFCGARDTLYKGETLYDRLTKSATGPGPEELARIASLPEPLPAILSKVLAVDPDERYETAAVFRAAITPYIVGGAVAVAEIIEKLYGDDLQLEQDRFAAAFPRPRTRENPTDIGKLSSKS